MAQERKESARQPDRITVRVRGSNPDAPDEGPALYTEGLRGVAVGFDVDGVLRVVPDAADLDLWERERLAEKLHDVIAQLLGDRLGKALH